LNIKLSTPQAWDPGVEEEMLRLYYI